MMYDQFFNGIDDSGYSNYNQSTFSYLKHINVHKNLGLAECEFVLQEDPASKSLVVEAGYLTVDNLGNVLLFSKESGKIYLRVGDIYKVIGVNPGGSHRGAFFYNGIYYSVIDDGTVSYFRLTPTDVKAKITDVVWNHGNIGTLKVDHVPIYAWYTKLYIGGSADVWVIDQDIVGGVITPGTLIKTSLNLPFTWGVTDFRDLDTNLIWGAFAENNGAIGQYRRYTDSFHQVDRVDGPINTFFGSSNSNVIFALTGHSGDIVHYTGAQAVLRQRIPDVEGVLPNPYNDAILDGRGLVAIHGKIFAYHQRKSGHPFALTHAFTCTGGEDAEIISIHEQTNPLGEDQLFVSWKKGDDAGLDSINYEQRAEGLIVSPIAEWFQESSHDQRTAKIFVEPKVGYTAHYHYLPEGSSIEIATAVNNNIQERTPKKCKKSKHIKERMLVETTLSDITLSGEKTRMTQGYITLKPNGKESPIIRSIELT